MRSSGIGVSPLRVAQDVRQGRQQPVDLPVGAHTYPQIVACKSGYGRNVSVASPRMVSSARGEGPSGLSLVLS